MPLRDFKSPFIYAHTDEYDKIMREQALGYGFQDYLIGQLSPENIKHGVIKKIKKHLDLYFKQTLSLEVFKAMKRFIADAKGPQFTHEILICNYIQNYNIEAGNALKTASLPQNPCAAGLCSPEGPKRL